MKTKLTPEQKEQADNEYLLLVNKYEKTLDEHGNEPNYDECEEHESGNDE